MPTDCWPNVVGLKGRTLRTLAQNKPFDILELSDHELIIRVGSSGRLRKIRRREIEGAYQELLQRGEISARDIQKRHAPRNSAFVSAILAELPGVDHQVKPIRLLHTG